MRRSRRWGAACLIAGCGVAFAALAAEQAQKVELTPVVSRALSRTLELPGEVQPYQMVSIHSKLRGYVERVLVDRGSVVHRGQLLVEIAAPEMKAQIAEAESKVQAARSDTQQAAAGQAAAESTFERLKKASETPGAISGNELVQAQKQVEAAQATVQLKRQAAMAAEAALRAQKDLEDYLRLTAPFDGVVTDRLVHPGALVGSGEDPVLLVVQEISRLRLVVAVPEENSGGIVRGARVEFEVPAYARRKYAGTVARISHSLDPKTRTMAVELDVQNRDGSLSPGMYSSVKWPIRGAQAALLVPKASVVTTTERVFVIRERNGRAEWTDVVKGAAEGDSIVVSGNLQSGDLVVRRATDEIRNGASLAGR